MLELKGFSTLFWMVPCTNTSKPISRDRSLSFHTQRLAFQPTQSQQTLKIAYITVNVSSSWTSSKLFICWDTMYPQVLKHSVRNLSLATLEASTHIAEDHRLIKWISSLWFYEETSGPYWNSYWMIKFSHVAHTLKKQQWGKRSLNSLRVR